ncbi:hypothetical protein [Bacillus sp. S/N-304-OC-R1]|uniref:hypothetical protein n=1 Tax=Bacillus sp. S/N-304-OC-R1 TaxID=2758034 RepID=UPI001C8E395A|nr:hypothetical protein [Bacillus sp. S/N-304-OC-R1]MBY0121635.1 hypothetical protein [Bacillus sp. S/N-304-OC-R1]
MFAALLFSTILLSGCIPELSFSEVSVNSAGKDIQSFIVDVKNENGVHLYFDNANVIYVYMNGLNVVQGEKAFHFTNLDVEESGETLNIKYKSTETTDYSNQSLTHEILYKLNTAMNY